MRREFFTDRGSSFYRIDVFCIWRTSTGGDGDYTKDITISATSLHEWMPSITYNPVENEFLVLWDFNGHQGGGREKTCTVSTAAGLILTEICLRGSIIPHTICRPGAKTTPPCSL